MSLSFKLTFEQETAGKLLGGKGCNTIASTLPFYLLKVPKCEIFNLMDSRDFYSIKPQRAGDFGTVMKKFKIVAFSS
jgi:hypothetical protein